MRRKMRSKERVGIRWNLVRKALLRERVQEAHSKRRAILSRSDKDTAKKVNHEISIQRNFFL